MIQPKTRKRALHRAKIIRGQIDGLIRAIEAEKYCVDVLTQSLAVQQSLKSLDALMLENHLTVHVPHQLNNPKEQSKAIKELLHLYRLSGK